MLDSTIHEASTAESRPRGGLVSDIERLRRFGLDQCPLCARPTALARLLYDIAVCEHCWSSFTNRRQLAFLLDLGLWCAVVQGAEFLRIPSSLEWPLYIGCSLAFAFKDGIQGISPGKWLMGLQVVDQATLQPIGPLASFKRNLVVSIPFGSVVAFILSFRLRRGWRLGDFWAKSKVVWRKHAHKFPFDSRGTCCPQCGYDLTGNISGICPECGGAVPAYLGRPPEEHMHFCIRCRRSTLPGRRICPLCARRLVNRRQIAFVLDLFVLACGWAMLSAAVGRPFGDFWIVGAEPVGLAMFLAFALRDGIRGMSPGKWIMGVQVICPASGRPAGFAAAFRRNALWLIPFVLMNLAGLFLSRNDLIEVVVPATWMATFAALLLVGGTLSGRARWGDLWAGTMVVARGFDPRESNADRMIAAASAATAGMEFGGDKSGPPGEDRAEGDCES